MTSIANTGKALARQWATSQGDLSNFLGNKVEVFDGHYILVFKGRYFSVSIEDPANVGFVGTSLEQARSFVSRP